jgi:hypothetical protein
VHPDAKVSTLLRFLDKYRVKVKGQRRLVLAGVIVIVALDVGSDTSEATPLVPDVS